MKSLLFLVILIISHSAYAQSGRKAPKTIPQPTPAIEETKPATTTKPADEPPPVTAEKNEDYRCTTDGSLARILDKDADSEKVFSSKAVDIRAVVTARPSPSYTRDARRAGIQGYVILKVMLSAAGEIGRVRVVRRLPYGLTENAIRAACKIEFKPATKDGQPVAQWLDVEYAFHLADSSMRRL